MQDPPLAHPHPSEAIPPPRSGGPAPAGPAVGSGAGGGGGASGVVTPGDRSDLLRSLEQELNQLRRGVRRQIEKRLASLAGTAGLSVAENREIASAIHRLLDGYGFRVRCGQCNRAAILRVSTRKSAPGGVFVFDHTIDGRRTFHGGGRTVPPLLLTVKPPRGAS